MGSKGGEFGGGEDGGGDGGGGDGGGGDGGGGEGCGGEGGGGDGSGILPVHVYKLFPHKIKFPLKTPIRLDFTHRN